MEILSLTLFKMGSKVNSGWKEMERGEEARRHNVRIFFYINEVLNTIMNFPVGCSLNCSKFKILCYDDDIVLFVLTAHALQVMLDTLSDTIRNLSLKINFQKLCHIVFRHKNKKIVSDVKINNQRPKTVTECKYLGVVLSDDLTCTKDVGRTKTGFFKQLYPFYSKFHCMDQKFLIDLFKLHALGS